MKKITAVMPQPITVERISYLINVKGIDPMISAIDLEMIKLKLRDAEEGFGWTYEQCDEAEVEYKRFLHLNKKFSERTVVPHGIMDDMWHQHILDTRAYHKDSLIIFGEYFHHFPYFGIRSDTDRRDLDLAFEETQRIYEAEFGEEMVRADTSHCKRACVSYCKRKCNTRA